MSLLEPFNGRITQYFGLPAASVSSLEPAMWLAGSRAYWQRFPGGTWHKHVHPGIDLAASNGTHISAMEAGVVTFAGWADGVSGNVVEVEIKAGVSYRLNHLDKIMVHRGEHVTRGQQLGTVGTSGDTTGPHSHIEVHLLEKGSDGVPRTMLWDPLLFLPGGARANYTIIKPPAPPKPKPVPTHEPTDKEQGDGDPYPMRMRRVTTGNDRFIARTVKSGKPVRKGAYVTSAVWDYVSGDTGFSEIARIPKADLPTAEQKYGDVLVGLWYHSNGDHFAYVKAVDIK